MINKLKAKYVASVGAVSTALLVPGAAFAGDLADAVTPGVNSLVTEVSAVVGVVALVVLACVGAKVVFSLLKKA